MQQQYTFESISPLYQVQINHAPNLEKAPPHMTARLKHATEKVEKA